MRSRIEKFALLGLGLLAGILLSLQFPAIADKASGSPLPIEDLRNFAEVFGRIKSDYVVPVSDKKLINLAINGMVSGLDPHSAYLDPAAYKDLQVGTQGEFGGLGIEVTMEDGLVKVISPIEDTPAYKAGIKPGDLIFKLDDMLVRGMTLNDAVARMRGKPGSKVTLTILRKRAPKPLIITLTRAVIHVKSVKFKMAQPGYAYVRITQFQEHTVQNLATALEDLSKKGQIKGLVLDLRNNPGGLLTAAVGVASAFLPHNSLVVYTEGRTPDAQMRLTANPDDYARTAGTPDYLNNLPSIFKRIPMVVLVNGGSASASEIVSGALQDDKRALIMGTQTFGKGSVQTILKLAGGAALKLTTARYYTPSGRSIQAKGIVPDIVVEDPSNSDGAFGLREADLEHHLLNDQTGSKTGKTGKPIMLPKVLPKPPVGKSGPVKFGAKNDYQLNQAITVLKGMSLMRGG